MSLQAFTNAVGRHERHTVRQNSIYRESWVENGTQHNIEPIQLRDFSVLTDISSKSDTIHSDRYHPTTWRREVSTVLEDNPRRYVLTGWWNSKDHWMEIRKEYISTLNGQFSFLPIFQNMDNCRSESITEALLSLKGDSYALLGADLAQIRQTGNMLANDSIKAVEVFKALRRGNLKRAASVLGIGGRHNNARGSKAVADWWLEYNYGWKPLAQSIHDTQQVLHEQTAKDMIIRGHGSGRSSGGYANRKVNGWIWTESWASSAKTTLKAKLNSPLQYKVSQLGVTNPLSIAWELVPWSFAIDWFVPVGNVLDALTATAGLSFDSGWCTMKGEATRGWTSQMPGDPNQTILVDPGSYVEKVFRFQREAFDGFPRPSFYADLTPFSTPRVLNASALIRQLFR